MDIDVVVLAGGDASQVDPAFSGPKSLIDIGGRPMVSYVMDALAGSTGLRQVVIALPEGVDQAPFAALGGLVVEGTTGVVDAIKKSILKLGPDGYVLIVSSDAPMINSDAIDDFTNDCRLEEAQVYYSIIRREDTEAVFPETRRTYMKLRDGTFTGGNVHLFEKATFMRNIENGNRLFNLRKNPISLVSLLGIGFVLKYLTGRLNLETLERKARELLGASVRAVVTTHPELAVDVDKADDLRLVQAHLVDPNRGDGTGH